jgi:hypothetical protein
MTTYRRVSPDPRVQAHYDRCRRAGTPHALALLFALGSPPMSSTDREFLEGRENGRQFEKTPGLGDYYAGVARARGVDPKGKVYLSGLAAYPGDPRAWVSGRGDAQRVCEDRGWSCRGSVNVKGRRAPPPEGKYRVADDIVADGAARLREEAGGALAREDSLEQARTQVSPNWK